jgi:hypothetical protein
MLFDFSDLYCPYKATQLSIHAVIGQKWPLVEFDDCPLSIQPDSRKTHGQGAQGKAEASATRPCPAYNPSVCARFPRAAFTNAGYFKMTHCIAIAGYSAGPHPRERRRTWTIRIALGMVGLGLIASIAFVSLLAKLLDDAKKA